METGAVLIGLAQIGVALAGFTTIASVVVTTGKTTSRNLFVLRVLGALVFSVCLMLFSLMPIIVNAADISGPPLWQISVMASVPFWLVFAGVGLLYILPRVLRDEKNNWFQTTLITFGGTAGFGCALFAIFSDQAAFWYMLSLGLVLMGTLVNITGVILSFPIFERLFVKPDPVKTKSAKDK